jgi:hypothetical protein
MIASQVVSTVSVQQYITDNSKYMNDGSSESFDWMIRPEPVNNAKINIEKGLDMVGKVWALPNTLFGFTIVGGLGYIGGKILGTDPQIQFGHNAIEFLNNPLLGMNGTSWGGAITFGNVINYGQGSGPTDTDLFMVHMKSSIHTKHKY